MAFRYNNLDESVDPRFAKFKFSFPLVNQDRYRSKLQFQIIKVNPPTFGSKLSASQTFDKAARGELELKELKGGSPATIDLGAKCDLYMPQAFQVNDIFSYETPSLGAIGAGALSAAQQGQGLIGAAASAVEQGFQSVSDLMSSITGSEIGRLGAVRAAQLAPIPQEVQAAVGIAAQTALNPNIRAMFRSVGLREFTFQFKFIPASFEEAEEVRAIINFFRYHAYPTEIPAGTDLSFGYEYPDMFRIKAFTKVENTYIQTGTHVKDCFLRNISTSYNPQLATYHADGNPTEIDLTLSFIEHRTMSRKDIESPYASSIQLEVTNGAGQTAIGPPTTGLGDTFGD